MKKLLPIISLILLVCLLVPAVTVLAGSYPYYVGIEVFNNSTTVYNNLTVLVSLNNTQMADSGYISYDALNTSVQEGSTPMVYGVGTQYLPIFFPSLAAYEKRTESYLLGYTPEQSSYSIALGIGGNYSIVDDPTLEPTDNFTLEREGFVDAAAGDNKTIMSKPGALEIYVSDTVSGNVTANVTGGVYIDDFSADTWTDYGTPKIYVSVPNSRIDFEAERSAIVEVTAKQVSTANGTSWYMDSTVHITSAAGGLGSFCSFGLWDAPSGYSGYAGDSIYMTLSSAPTIGLYRFDGGVLDYAGAVNVAFGTDYYIALARTSATQAELSVYSDAQRTTHMAGSPLTLTIPSTINNLQYIAAKNYNDGSGAANEVIGWIDDLGPVGVTLTHTSISSGEHDIELAEDNPFYSLGIDATSSPITPVTDGLILNIPLWQSEFSANTTSIDSYAMTVNATDFAPDAWTLNSGWDFDGNNDYIGIGHDASQLLTTGGTVETWIKPNSVGEGARGRIVDKSANANADDGFFLACEDTNRISFRIDEGTYIFSAENSVMFGDSNWYHVVTTWDNIGYTRIYVNGSLSGTPGISADPAGITTNNALRIGQVSVSTSRTFDGNIGEARVYNRELTADEVLQNYNATEKNYTTGDIVTHSSLLSVPDNGNDWLISGDTYLEYLKIYKGGSLGAWYQPITMYDGGLTDRSGNGNTGTIIWGSNPSGIEITIGPITSMASTTASIPGTSALPQVVPSLPIISLVENPAADVTGMPQYDLVHRAATSMGWSDQFAYIVMFTILALGLGFAGLVLMNTIWGFVVPFGATEMLGVTAVGGTTAGIGLVPVFLALGVVLLALFVTWLWTHQ